MSVLRLDDITMQFGGVIAVNNLSIQVEKGQIVALIGPNGAGKTTAFNVITGVYAPTNGCIELNGEKIISNFPKGDMKKLYRGENQGKYTDTVVHTSDKITKLGIARTFQNIRLFKSLTVFENVLISTHMRSKAGLLSATFGLNRQEELANREAAMTLLETVGLLDVKDEIAGSLPYGKQRHLEIARALGTKPELLLLDEPAAGMNPQETEELTNFIKDLKDKFGLTILMIEHHMDMVMEISDKIYVLDFGKLIAHGSPHEVQNNPKVIEAYLGVEDVN